MLPAGWWTSHRALQGILELDDSTAAMRTLDTHTAVLPKQLTWCGNVAVVASFIIDQLRSPGAGDDTESETDKLLVVTLDLDSDESDGGNATLPRPTVEGVCGHTAM